MCSQLFLISGLILRTACQLEVFWILVDNTSSSRRFGYYKGETVDMTHRKLMYCIDCKLFITNNVVVLQFAFFEWLFWQMRRTDHKYGILSKARSPRLVLLSM